MTTVCDPPPSPPASVPDWGRRRIPRPLRDQRRRRRRAAVALATAHGHRLSRWMLLCNMRSLLYGHDGGNPNPWEWSRVCADCGHRLYATIAPYWTSVDGIPEDRGIDGCAATPGIDQPCPVGANPQLALFPTEERSIPRVPISVMEAIGGLPAPVRSAGRGTGPGQTVMCNGIDVDPATGLCRQCGQPRDAHPDKEWGEEAR